MKVSRIFINEIKLMHYSRLLWITTALLIILGLLYFALTLSHATTYMDTYLNTKARDLPQGANIGEVLRHPLNLVTKKDSNGATTVESKSSIHVAFQQMLKAFIPLSGPHLTSGLLHWASLVSGVFVFPFFGYAWGRYDYLFGTLRLKHLQAKWQHFLLTKLILLLTLATLLIILLSALTTQLGDSMLARFTQVFLEPQETALLLSHMAQQPRPDLVAEGLLALGIIYTHILLGFTLAAIVHRIWISGLLFLCYLGIFLFLSTMNPPLFTGLITINCTCLVTLIALPERYFKIGG